VDEGREMSSRFKVQGSRFRVQSGSQNFEPVEPENLEP
jgi:hypothetical protein